MVAVAFVLVVVPVNAEIAKVTVPVVVLVPPIQVEQYYILSLKNSKNKTS